MPILTHYSSIPLSLSSPLKVMEDIAHHKIPIYNFPYDPEEDDDETVEENSELRSLLPFALIGCEEEVTVNGRKVRGRQYPWGVVEVDNPQHCDFVKLRYALLRYKQN